MRRPGVHTIKLFLFERSTNLDADSSHQANGQYNGIHFMSLIEMKSSSEAYSWNTL